MGEKISSTARPLHWEFLDTLLYSQENLSGNLTTTQNLSGSIYCSKNSVFQQKHSSLREGVRLENIIRGRTKKIIVTSP